VNANRIGGFTAVELVAVVAVLLILAGVISAVFISGRPTAVALRRTDAASTLNAAEHSLLDYNSTTAPVLGGPTIDAPSDPTGRIVVLKAAGFIGSLISAEDVALIRTNGIYLWIPTPP
jgi:type II secretory pathway pseudopilin PulG